ncbi:MAG: putative rane protein insertion efficiency factor [Planctomycetota bacterium]|jgi:putative membrane protein insertion efficiency factor
MTGDRRNANSPAPSHEKPASDHARPEFSLGDTHHGPTPQDLSSSDHPLPGDGLTTATYGASAANRGLLQACWHWCAVVFPSWFLIAGVRVYQWTLSPILGGHCRFSPSCSHYFIQAVRKYGPWKGSGKGVLRICRCHPFHPGGYDPP